MSGNVTVSIKHYATIITLWLHANCSNLWLHANYPILQLDANNSSLWLFFVCHVITSFLSVISMCNGRSRKYNKPPVSSNNLHVVVQHKEEVSPNFASGMPITIRFLYAYKPCGLCFCPTNQKYKYQKRFFWAFNSIIWQNFSIDLQLTTNCCLFIITGFFFFTRKKIFQGQN